MTPDQEILKLLEEPEFVEAAASLSRAISAFHMVAPVDPHPAKVTVTSEDRRLMSAMGVLL